MSAENIACVGLFFYVNGKFLVSKTDLESAEEYGKFLVHDKSHFEVWEKSCRKMYKVDFDYYPRGRFVYDASEAKYIVYTDRYILSIIMDEVKKHKGVKVSVELDEHYQCKKCNKFYFS